MESQKNLFSDNLVLMGYISGMHGLFGEMKLRSYSDPFSILQTKTVWIRHPNHSFKQAVKIILESTRKKSKNEVLIRFLGIHYRELAECYKGYMLYINRSNFPNIANNIYYWIDLINSSIYNLQGVYLGEVVRIMENKDQAILCIKKKDKEEQELLIPFVEKIILKVEHRENNKKYNIVVDWQKNWYE